MLDEGSREIARFGQIFFDVRFHLVPTFLAKSPPWCAKDACPKQATPAGGNPKSIAKASGIGFFLGGGSALPGLGGAYPNPPAHLGG